MITLRASQRINASTLYALKKIVDKANDNRKTRIIGEIEITKFVELLRKHRRDKSVHRICVYSYDGFVPNSYKYAAYITRLLAERTEDGAWELRAESAGANRSNGEGSLVVINTKGI